MSLDNQYWFLGASWILHPGSFLFVYILLIIMVPQMELR